MPADADPPTREAVRVEILKAIDFANLELEFPRIVHWLGLLPAAERTAILGELEAIAAGAPRPGPPARRGDAMYLLHDLGLRDVRWDRS